MVGERGARVARGPRGRAGRGFRRGRGFRGKGRGQCPAGAESQPANRSGGWPVRSRGGAVPSRPGHHDASALMRVPHTGLNDVQIHAHSVVDESVSTGHERVYQAWRIYLPTQEFSPFSPHLIKLKAAQTFFASDLFHGPTREELYVRKAFSVPLSTWQSDPAVLRDWPEFERDWLEHGEIVVGILSLARHQMILAELKAEMEVNAQTTGYPIAALPVNFPIIRARFTNVGSLMPLKDLKTSAFNQTVSIQGTVVRVSHTRPCCTWLAFKCLTCQGVQSVYQPYGKFLEPIRCPGTACRGRRFSALRSHRQTITVDRQTIRVQEIVQHESGRVPRTIESELTEDLCDCAVPGDVITLTGVVKNANVMEKGAGKDRFMFQLYLHAVCIQNAKSSRSGRDRSSHAGIEFTLEDYSLVREIHAFDSQIFKLVVHSLCPSIYGHDLVKAGFILGLFGGTNRNQGDKSALSVRGDPHILVVGDPGLGKSQMLTSCVSVAPRGVFVTGNTTTSSGLTVTLSKEAGNDFALEAGALVLADQGCCCIDEFDKMNSQYQALLEAMEQQSISIAKAGVVCSLPARTGVLAAANPVGGHYNKSKTVSENLKLKPALLSRFDLVFILIDKPNEEMDQFLSEHIMKLHKKQTQPKSNDEWPTLVGPGDAAQLAHIPEDATLIERLRKNPRETIQPIGHDLLRKYIAYARKYVSPELTSEACRILQDFYVELRQKYHSSESMPITLRQLESLKRLTEARAKVELREEATEQDARDVVEIMRASMIDTYSDGEGVLDFSRSLNGSGMSTRGAAKKFVNALQKRANMLRQEIFSVDEMKSILSGCGAQVANFFDFLTSLNTQGYLLKKSAKSYQLLTVEF
ncbi:hypothetical protein TCAL_03630 [Tigriopus californicus]|uniref:DNA helicase MCM8 n=1 Tax=Tigriopus californicus TaxID=6832 RepID=A0A553NCE8_TIGCA|nr:DNA helicase MCM8-like [Tigriopus californicus]TRY63121.1 hypothetical protein TCAL_03630 [Tigriopus californicus]